MSEERKKWTVQFNDGQWAPAVVVNPWLPTTRNYFAADAVAKRANQVKLKWTEWTRVFDMIREMDARLAEAANERASRAEVEPGSPSRLREDAGRITSSRELIEKQSLGAYS